jgi:hypothetical protein
MSTQITSGAFVNVASQPYFIPLQQKISFFKLKNLTRSGVTALGVSGSLTSTRIVRAYWNPYMTAGTAEIEQNGTVSGILAPLNVGIAAINGFTIFNAANPPFPGPAITVNSFTPGTTTVWTTNTAHGFVVGDIVRVTNVTSAPQFGGLSMTVVTVGSTTTFTTLLDSTGATTSVGVVKKVGNNNLPMKSLYFPENRVIAKITNANPMVVTTLIAQNYAVGDVVTFDMPSAWGVPQLTNSISGLPFQATISAVNNAIGTQTVTFANVDSTNFGVFATNPVAANSNPGHWLLSGAYAFTFPQMVPQGAGNTNNLFNVVPSPLPYGNQDVLAFARQNQASNGILIGAGDGTNSASTGGLIGSTLDAWSWEAYTSLQEYPQT